jgi:hypothetical protein
MNTNPAKAPSRHGLRDISMADFWKDPLVVVDTLQAKLNGLPIDTGKHAELASQVHLAMELLRAISTRRYGAISFRATVDLLHAVDYFLVLNDRHPDSREDGYTDDAEEMRSTFAKHAAEMDNFRLWLARQG